MITDRRALLILDVLFVLALAAQILMPLSLLDAPHLWRIVAYSALVVVMAALWIYWRHHQTTQWVTFGMVVTSLAAAFVGDGPIPLLLVAFALVILVVVRGPRAGILMGAVMLAGATLLMVLVYRQDPAYVGTQVLAVVVALGIVWLIATLLWLFVAASREAEAAHAALAHSFETEKELMLAQERAREAGELHDGLGHQLTAVGLLLSAAQRQRGSDPDRAWTTVEEARTASVEALQDMRTWVRALHPTPLDDLEDGAAFRTLAERFRGSGLEVVVDTSITHLDPPVALVVRRCVQEGLTNVARHARATRADVLVHQANGQVRVEIADDGTGMSPAAEGFGLGELRQRVETLGGTLTTSPASQGGVLLSVVVPT